MHAALDAAPPDGDARFWITATKVKALCGMGSVTESEELRKTLGPEDWKAKFAQFGNGTPACDHASEA